MDEPDIDRFRFTGPLGFWERDVHTGSMRWSGAIDDILGLQHGAPEPSLEAMLGVMILREEQEALAAALERSLHDRGEHHHLEYRCRRPDGREVTVRNEWSVERDTAGRPTMFRGVLQDVTHRKRAKATLHLQTALLALLYDVAACANEAKTLDEALERSLERICTFGRWPVGSVYLVSGHEPRELVPASVWHTADPDRFEALRVATRRTRYSPGMGTPGRVMRDGRPVWSTELREHSTLPATVAAQEAGLGAVLDLPVLVGTTTVAVMELFAYERQAPDEELMHALTHVAAQLGRVFERKRSEDALRESEGRLRQILESMPIGVFVIDAAGTPYFANGYARGFGGQDPGAGALKGVHDVYVAGTDEPYPWERNPLRRALDKESSVVADLEYACLGRRIPVEAWGSPVFDEQGRVAYAVCAFYDIAERRKVERMKDEFVSVVSHELRTPLTSIQGAIGLLENGVLGPIEGEALEMAQIAGAGCRRLLRLVNELLDIQKLSSGAPSLHAEPLALGPILEQAVSASRPYAAALEIRIELEDDAPGAVVLADGDRIAQVVANLLSNAIKYTPPGESVRVAASRRAAIGEGGSAPGSPSIRVLVEDHGPGVPDEFRGSLFRKFSQADASDARQKSGTGLGLAICKVIVEQLGGTIAHEPRAEGGARFYFELPEAGAPGA